MLFIAQKVLIFGVLLPLYKEQSITKRHNTTLMKDNCIIRIYERQYYMGNYWTLNQMEHGQVIAHITLKYHTENS